MKCHGESVNQGGGGSSPGELLQNGEFRMVTESVQWMVMMVIKIQYKEIELIKVDGKFLSTMAKNPTL